MENIKNFIGNVMVSGSANNNNRSNNNAVASVADKSQQNSNVGALNYARASLRNRTESECSNTSVSSIDTPSNYGRPTTQKDKDSYFWVM